MYEDLSPTQFAAKRDAGENWQLLDVREPWEIEIVSVPDSIKMRMSELAARHPELDNETPVAVMCHSGERSAKAAEFLTGSGFKRVANIVGGIDAWAQEVDVTLPRY